jgi:hypothetical protein
MTMLDAARRYLADGLHVIPAEGKVPRVPWKEYQVEPPHADQVDEWFTRWPDANLGFVLGRGVMVVDLDGEGAEGLLHNATVTLPKDAPRVRTGNGQHVYLAVDEPVGDRIGLLTAPGGGKPQVDIRGVGFVVAPPSTHPETGRRYEWLVPFARPVPKAPDALLRLIKTPRIAETHRDDAPGWVAEALRGVGQGLRDATATKLAGYFIGKGLDRETTAAVLAQSFARNCEPPFPPGEVAKCVASIDRRHAINGEAIDPATVTPLGIGLDEFLAIELPPAETYVEDVLTSDGSGFVGGEEKLGKTLYALDEALALALGQPVCGKFRVPARRRVLFLEEEDPKRRTQRRLKALLRGRGLDPDDPAIRRDLGAWFRIEVFSGFRLTDPAQVARLRAALATFKPHVVYFDVLRKIARADLNKADQAQAITDILDDLKREHDVVFRVLHHFRKIQGAYRAGRGSQEIGGSYVWGAWAEDSVFLEPIGRKQGSVKLEVQTKDGAVLPAHRLKIAVDGPAHDPRTITLQVEEITEQSAADQTEGQILQAVSSLPKQVPSAGKAGVPIKAIATATRRSDKTVRRHLKALERRGLVEVAGKLSSKEDLWAVIE